MNVLQRQIGKHESRVFTYAGKPLKAANTKAWANALKRAGITDFRWHDLRHTWATWQRQAGTPTHELQRLGGRDGNRTCDTRIFNPLLYRLSYPAKGVDY